MISPTEIDAIYNQFKSEKHLNSEYLVGLFIELIKKIEVEKIDFERSEIKIEDSFQFNLFSKYDVCCNCFFEILDNNIIDIQLNEGAEYLYFYRVEKWTDVDILKKSMQELLRSPIEENLTFCDKKLIKAKYIINTQEYISVFGNCFLKKKSIKNKLYEAWL